MKLQLIVLAMVLATLREIGAIYEDQIGKFDWHQSYIGKIQDGFISLSDLVLTTTEENVLAALSAKSGNLLWRQILEKEPRGKLKFAAVFTDTSASEPQNTLLSVNGNGYPTLVRGWDPLTGIALWEWSLTLSNPDKVEEEFWFIDNLVLYHVLAFYGSHLEVTQYFASTGQPMKTGTTRITTAWITKGHCILAKPFFVCGIKNQILGVNLLPDNGQLFTKPLLDELKEPIRALKGSDGTIIANGEILSLKGETFSSKLIPNADYYVETVDSQRVLIQISTTDKEFRTSASDLVTGEDITELLSVTPKDDYSGRAQIKSVKCKRKPEIFCRILLDTEDNSIILMQQGKIKWSREESLTNIAAVEMVELPLSYLEGSIEGEFNSKDGNILEGFIRRTTSQISQVKSIFLTVLGLSSDQNGNEKLRNKLIRDAFGLHKMIVVVTKCGKVFGIDNMSGKIHWMKYLPELETFKEGSENVKLIAQRTARHFPHPIQYAIIGRNRVSDDGFIYQFNPITGVEVDTLRLDYKIKQTAILHESEASTFVRPILILDDKNEIHVLPRAFSRDAVGLYLFTATNEGILNGFFVEKDLNVLPIWELNLNQKLINVALKNSIEHVHSQGRVLSDRSVLYKYINPNLIAVATLGNHAVHKTVLNVHLIDVVSGSIIFSMSHKRAKEPFYMVHSENWLAYTYYNEKVRRTEISTMELYEGKTQTNSTVWSSLDPPPLPMVERQSYIIPATVVALKETITEKGITNKDVLIGLSTGAVLEMPWMLLDPRRPVSSPNQQREEGVIPYIPEIPLPSENIVNYNQSVARIKGIHTAPSGLESTCLVMAYGLDIFVTRVAPSKTFDSLKDDFDYFLITIVLIGLTTASYVVKYLASKKALKQAWK